MTFKLEDIKLEGINLEQKVFSRYDFSENKYLSGDRTFWLLDILTGECTDCSCDNVCKRQHDDGDFINCMDGICGAQCKSDGDCGYNCHHCITY